MQQTHAETAQNACIQHNTQLDHILVDDYVAAFGCMRVRIRRCMQCIHNCAAQITCLPCVCVSIQSKYNNLCAIARIAAIKKLASLHVRAKANIDFKSYRRVIPLLKFVYNGNQAR